MKHLTFLLSLALVAGCCSKAPQQTISVIPAPAQVEVKCGEFNVASASLWADEAMDDASRQAVADFASQIAAASGDKCTLADAKSSADFIFALDATLPAEGYTIKVSPRKVTVKASAFNGFLFAMETVRQLLPVQVYNGEAAPEADWTIPALEIKDEPRFSYRGLHMDPARHFWEVEEVKRYIDIMAIHKMNYMHWHLTDDQGWRIEIKKYPKLTEIGAWRDRTLIGHLRDNIGYDDVRHGGFYTQEQIREVVAYAAKKGITVIPEIDLPGHMVAALASYPEYGCTGGPYKVWEKWGISDQVLCVGKESTFEFLEGILAEVIELFPSEYIHIGGDECPKTEWEKCPVCQAKIKELGLKDDDKYKAEHYLQSYVTSRIEKFINEKGRKMIGWDEILEGELAPNATVMSWRGTKGGIEAAKLGHDAIMTPNSYYYLDYYQSEDKENEPLAIGGFLSVERCYSYEPFTEEMTQDQRDHILGVQANVWTEYIKTPEHLEYMVLPRASALSEVQWCAPENKNYERFLSSLDHLREIFDACGYNYAKHVFEEK